MSETPSTANASGRTLLDPAILANARRIMLNIFGMEIGHRRAKGTVGSTNQTLIDERRECDGVHNQEESHRIDLDDTPTDRRRRSTTTQ